MSDFPHVPGPWNNAHLPRELQQLDMVYLRSYLYPKFAPVVTDALEARRPFQPVALLPAKYGPRNHGVNALRAWLRSNTVRRTVGTPPRSVAPSYQGPAAPPIPVSMPNAVAQMFGTPPPGLDIPQTPFVMRTGLPAAASERRAELMQTGFHVPSSGSVEALVARTAGRFYNDPFGRR